MERFDFQVIEKKWQKRFSHTNLNREKGEKFYCLEMFPILRVKYIWAT